MGLLGHHILKKAMENMNFESDFINRVILCLTVYWKMLEKYEQNQQLDQNSDSTEEVKRGHLQWDSFFFFLITWLGVKCANIKLNQQSSNEGT